MEIRCEICFIFVTFQWCEVPCLGEVSLYRDFQLSFNPKGYDNPLTSTIRSQTPAQCSLAFHSGVLFAEHLHSKSTYFAPSSSSPDSCDPAGTWIYVFKFWIPQTEAQPQSQGFFIWSLASCLVSVVSVDFSDQVSAHNLHLIVNSLKICRLTFWSGSGLSCWLLWPSNTLWTSCTVLPASWAAAGL